jgi:hypothetical protein
MATYQLSLFILSIMIDKYVLILGFNTVISLSDSCFVISLKERSEAFI